MVYLLKMVIFHGYVTNKQMVLHISRFPMVILESVLGLLHPIFRQNPRSLLHNVHNAFAAGFNNLGELKEQTCYNW
jgi:hypothetical protein